MKDKKITPLNASQRDMLQRIMDYFGENINSTPWRSDYIILRMAQQATNEYTDTIFIPNFNNADTMDFYTPFKCNAFTSDAVKIITGAYEYRLGARFGCVYGQQMAPIYYQNLVTDTISTDRMDQRLVGVNLLAHPIHSIIPTLTPTSNASKGSVTIHPSAHGLMKQNFKNANTTFKLYVIDINLLL
jgi:hypothetical protein